MYRTIFIVPVGTPLSRAVTFSKDAEGEPNGKTAKRGVPHRKLPNEQLKLTLASTLSLARCH